MGATSISHWIIVALVILVLFGRGRIAETMGEVGRGLTSFRRGLADRSDDQKDSDGEVVKLSQPDQSSGR